MKFVVTIASIVMRNGMISSTTSWLRTAQFFIVVIHRIAFVVMLLFVTAMTAMVTTISTGAGSVI